MKRKQDLLALKPLLVIAAQKAYDEWEQNAEGWDELLGFGGICQDIADNMAEVLTSQEIDCHILSALVGDQHVWVVCQLANGIYMVDIPPSIYEIGSGFVWRKKPDVIFEIEDIAITCLDRDPQNFENYSDSP